MWIQTGVRVRKRLSWVLTSLTLTFDLWPWPFAWTSLLTMVITPENFMMIRWWEHGEQGKSEGFESCDRPTVRKRPIWVKIGDVLSRVTLKFDGWPWKTIGHLSFAVSSFVQHFIAIGEFKLELLFGNAQFGSNSTIGHLFYATSSFVHHFVAISDFKLELQSRNPQFGSNSTSFRAVWPWNLMDDLEKQ